MSQEWLHKHRHGCRQVSGDDQCSTTAAQDFQGSCEGIKQKYIEKERKEKEKVNKYGCKA